jgi:hypothetical protein
MLLSYSSFKNDILSFQNEEYIKTLYDPTLYNSFVDFIENYKEIENEDFKKPIFSQTTKFKKIPNNFKNFKYQKINRDNDETSQPMQFSFDDPVNENEKIAVLIRTHLNKISKDTYKKISLEFINELIEIKNDQLFEILCNEILKKCLFDNKYRNLYVNLCYKIWSNKQIHNNLINIIIKDSKYYWSKIDDNINNGPFSSETLCKNDAFSKINFKRYLLNYIQKLYNNRDVNFTDLTEEEEFIKKKKILLLVELIAIMYLEKYINFDIINIIITDLLHIINSSIAITEIEIESLYSLIKTIHENKLNVPCHLSEYKNIFMEFINIIENTITLQNTKRTTFFLKELVRMFNEIINNSNKNMKSIVENSKNNDKHKYNTSSSYSPSTTDKKNIVVPNKINYDELFMEKLQDWNIDELYGIYIKTTDSNLLYKIIDKSLSGKTINNQLYKLLIKIDNKVLLKSKLNIFIENINDIKLDIPDIIDKLLKISQNCQLDEEFILKINTLYDDDDDSEDEDEDDDDDSEEDDEDEDNT